MVKEEIADVKSYILEDDRKRVDEFETNFWMGIADTVRNYDRYYDSVIASGLDRKRYAQDWMPTIKKNDPVAPGIVFGRFDGRDTRTMVLDIIKKSLGSQTKIDEVRNLWGGHRWTYYFEGDL